MLVLVILLSFAVFRSTYESPGPSGTALPVVKEAKESVQEEAYDSATLEKYLDCFHAVQCDQGQADREKMFECFKKAKPEEQRQYCQWLVDSSNFTTPDMEKICEEYCPLDDEAKDTVDKHFIRTLSNKFQEICGSRVSGQCHRVLRTWKCLEVILEEKFATGVCKRAIQENVESAIN